MPPHPCPVLLGACQRFRQGDPNLVATPIFKLRSAVHSRVSTYCPFPLGIIPWPRISGARPITLQLYLLHPTLNKPLYFSFYNPTLSNPSTDATLFRIPVLRGVDIRSTPLPIVQIDATTAPTAFPHPVLLRGNPRISELPHARTAPSGNSITRLGELPSFGRPDLSHSFTSDATFPTLLLSILNADLFTARDRVLLSTTCNGIAVLIRAWEYCRQIDVEFLRDPRPQAATQESIPPERQWGYMALTIQCNGFTNAAIRWLNGSFLDAARVARIPEILETFEPVLDPNHLQQLSRVLRSGAPAKLVTHFSDKNRQAYRAFGNHKSASDTVLLEKAVNKDERNCFAYVVPLYLEPFMPHVHTSPISIISKPGKNDRIAFDGTFAVNSTATPINSVTQLADEWPISYGTAFQRQLIHVWNLRITYPTEVIYLWDDDAKAAFRQVKSHPDTAGAYCYQANGMLVVSVAQVFGGNTCPSNWMIVADARAKRAEFLHRPENAHLRTPPYPLEAQIQLELTPPDTVLAQAIADVLNTGIILPDGTRLEVRHSTFVDDNLMAAILSFILDGTHYSLQALYELLGDPGTTHFDAVASDKFLERKCSAVREQLGFIIDTNRLMVAFPLPKRHRLYDTVKNWHDARKQFTALEIARLIGVLMHASTVCWWSRFILIDLQQEVKAILKQNAKRVARSIAFQQLERLAAGDLLFEDDPLAVPSQARAIWRCKSTNFITKRMRYSLSWLRAILMDRNASFWETPIAHLIPREPTMVCEFDACLDGAGGICHHKKFLWILQWPETVKQFTLNRILSRNNSDLIDINLLEFAASIICYAASIVAISQEPPAPAPPVFYCKGDNVTSLSWLRRPSSPRSPAATALSHLLATMASRAGMPVFTEHIPGVTNVIPDRLSRYTELTTQGLTPNPDTHAAFWTSLFTDFPQTRSYRLFLPSQELLSLLLQALSTSSVPAFDSPIMQQLQIAEPSIFGRFATDIISETRP